MQSYERESVQREAPSQTEDKRFLKVSLSLLFTFLFTSLFIKGCKLPDQGAGKIGPIKKWGVHIGARIQSIPAVDSDGTIYFGATDHNLYAYSDRGKFLWKFTIDSDGKVWSPALTPGGRIAFATSDGYLYLIDTTGHLIWKRQPRERLSGCPPVIAPGNIVVTSGDLVVVAFTLHGGKKVELGKKLPPVKSCIAQNPKFKDRVYYIGLGNIPKKPAGGPLPPPPKLNSPATKATRPSPNAFYAWKIENNKLKLEWKRELKEGLWSLPGFDPDGNLYVGTLSGEILSLTPDGKLRWKFTAPKMNKKDRFYGQLGGFARPYYSPKGQVLAVRMGEGIYALTPKGKKLWVFPEGERPFNGYLLAAPNGNIFAGSFDQHLYAITPEGKLHYKFFTYDRIFFGGALSPDGSTYYFGSEDKHFYALHTKKLK